MPPVVIPQPASDEKLTTSVPTGEDEDRFRRIILPSAACILGLLGALVLTFLTPPLQVPDENRHFFRAYQLSEGLLFSRIVNGRAGDYLPVSLHAMEVAVLNEEGSFERPAAIRPSAATLNAELQRPLDATNVAFIDFTGAAFYSPLPYLPQSAAIAIGRALQVSPVKLLYLGRLANAIAVVLLIAWSIRIAPYGHEVLLFLGLLPMALYQYASVSADALVTATCIAFFAVVLRAEERGRWTKTDLVIASALATVFCSVKPVYAPFLLVGLIPALNEPAQFRRSLRSHAIVCAVALGITVAWLIASSPSMAVNNVATNHGVNPSAQVRFVLGHPFTAGKIVVTSFVAESGSYAVGAIGVFGWRRVLLPGWAYWVPLVWLCTLAFARPAPRIDRQAIWKLLLASASAVLVMIALYIIWTPLAYEWVIGVQGRYFIPCLVLAGLAICPKPINAVPRVRYAITVSLVAVSLAATWWTIATGFPVR